MASAHPVSQPNPYTQFNLVPVPANAVPLGATILPNNAPARPNFLTRISELHTFLVQCDDPAYYSNYFQLLNSATPAMLNDALKSLKDRSQWLDEQQNIEFSRMRALNIIPMAVGNALDNITEQPLPLPISKPLSYTINTEIAKHDNGSTTPETTAVPSLPQVEITAALEQHQLIRDSTTPPNLASIDPETDAQDIKGRKKGAAKKGQAKLKRKRL